MRLEREHAHQTPGQQRTPFHKQQRAAEERRSDEAVLPNHGVRQDRGKRASEQKPNAIADNAANGRHIERKGQEHPCCIGLNIGNEREQRRHKQKRRWVVPGKLAMERMSERCNLSRLLDGDVISGGRISIEGLPASGPHIDEVGRDRVALRINQPTAVDKRCGEIDSVRYT